LLYGAITNDPLGLVVDTVNGAYESVVTCVTTSTCIAPDQTHGTARDRQLVAELQGNADAAVAEAADDLGATLVELTAVPGVGKAAKSGVVGLVDTAVDQGRRNAGHWADDVRLTTANGSGAGFGPEAKPKTNTGGNNGSYDAEGDFGPLNQPPKIPSSINTAINDKVKVVDQENLPSVLAKTFKGKEFITVETTKNVTLYRKFGGAGDQATIDGGFATTAKNAGRQETAVYPKWSTSRFEAEIDIPPGEKLNIGKVAEQPVGSNSPKYRGKGDQVVLPRNYPMDWVKSVRDGKTGKEYSMDEFRTLFPDQFRGGR
jgi:hypothetical protein